MAGAVGGPGTDYRDRYSPRVRRRVKGKQVKVLCDLVTVSPEHMTRLRAVTDENREGGYVRRGTSQETCQLWVLEADSGSRVIGRTDLRQFLPEISDSGRENGDWENLRDYKDSKHAAEHTAECAGLALLYPAWRFLPENVFSVSLLSNPAGLVKISKTKTGGNET